jgi:hypothetical protein
MDRRIYCWFTRELAAGHIALAVGRRFRVHKASACRCPPASMMSTRDCVVVSYVMS